MNNETENAGETKRGSHAWQIAVAVVVCVALVALLVLPGFLAAAFSKLNREKVVFCFNGNLAWVNGYNKELPAKYPVESLALAPSGLLMEHSPALRRFYTWQYHAAGGVETWIEMD